MEGSASTWSEWLQHFNRRAAWIEEQRVGPGDADFSALKAADLVRYGVRPLTRPSDMKDGFVSFANLLTLSEHDAEPTADPKTMESRFIISSARKDRHGDIVVPQGCTDTLKDYEKNPVVFFAHNSIGKPIASSKEHEIIENKRILATAVFSQSNQESEQIFRMVEAKELRGASIGFIPHVGKILKADDKAEDGLKKDEILFEPWMAFKFLKWTLLEWSIVPVPANADCLRVRIEKGFGGKPLSEQLRHWLEPHATRRIAQASGATLLSSEAKSGDLSISAAFMMEMRSRLSGIEKTVTEGLGSRLVALEQRFNQDCAEREACAAAKSVADAVRIEAEKATQENSDTLALIAQSIGKIQRCVHDNQQRLNRLTGKID